MGEKKLNSDEFAFMQALKADFSTGPMVEVNIEAGYKIKIIGRGEQLFYQQEDKALICEIQVRNDLIYRDSIKRWDDGSWIDENQKEIILHRIINYFRMFQGVEAKVV
ncbi:hypothetical protein ACAW74_12560 [Fibrella sp. WM1]|uniref:hypothetical protein n=1 Tax=Fibrella musci TaxID=3242485 RepID=UPI00351FBDB0